MRCALGKRGLMHVSSVRADKPVTSSQAYQGHFPLFFRSKEVSSIRKPSRGSRKCRPRLARADCTGCQGTTLYTQELSPDFPQRCSYIHV